MSEENNTPAPASKITPLSVVSMGNLNALVVRKETEGKSPEVFVTIKRTSSKPDDDPLAIPLIEVPALVMLLKAVAEPAMSVTSLTSLPAPTPPPPAKADPTGRLNVSASNLKTRKKTKR